MFRALVPREFSFLQGYGFVLSQQTSHLFTARSPYVKIAIELHYSDPIVHVGTLNADFRLTMDPKDIAPDWADLETIVRLRDPVLHIQYRCAANTQDEFVQLLSSRAEMLKACCVDFLNGDLSSLPEANAAMRAYWQRRRGEAEERWDKKQISAHREKASAAFRKGEYGVALAEYQAIESSLSDAEREKLEYAKKQRKSVH
jgi:hypothetical protein